MSIEAKDIYNANNLINKNKNGYITKNKNGQINIKKFINALDFSLDLTKMREIYEKTYRRNNFTFNINNKNYTQTAICVTFKYAYKEFNKCGKKYDKNNHNKKCNKDIYIKAGYEYDESCFEDSVYIIGDELIGIITNEKVNNPIDFKLLGNSFVFEDGVYKQKGNIKTILSKKQLREHLYNHGFYCNKVKYIRFKRSSGSSRVGKCLFIDQALYKTFHKWDLCGLKIKEGDEIDLAAFESYISLTSSSIIDTIYLKPENFLVIDDYDSVFEDNVIGVDYIKGKLSANEGKYTIKNSLFDGESLLDSNLFAENYCNKGMLLLRNRFFKTAGFNTNIQLWFKENNITDVSQLNGFTLAKEIEDIKIITTPSSIKYIKFAPLQQWFDNLDNTFGIVKYEKPTHFFDGRMVQSHYQLINTLQLSNEDIKKLLQPNLDYISLIRSDPDVLKYHIDYPYDDIEITPLRSKNEIIFKLMGMNSDFCKTKLYYDFRNDLIKSMIRNLKQGHILINGNYSTLLGNGIEMLQHSIGKFNGESIIGKGNVYCKNFEFNKILLGSRSPHINAGNVLLVNNVNNELINKYFNLSNEIVYVNAIGENIQQRLNGCDYDSDTLLLTDNKILINAAQKNYNKFKVPTCLVKSKKRKRYYTNKDKADLDDKTSDNKIGDIVNLSQYLNSVFWNNINRGQTIEQNSDLYYDICILAVLSGIEIDRAKKEYEINSTKVLKYLKTKWKIEQDNKLVKPMFFKMITKENGYELNARHKYKYFNTPMDYLQKQIASFNFRENRKPKEEFLKFSDIVKTPNMLSIGGSQYFQCNRILNLIENLKNDISALYINYDKKSKTEKEVVWNESLIIKQECVEYINDISISDATMYLLVKNIENNQYKHISKLIFTTLFGTPNKKFFKLIIEGNDEINELVENKYGSIHIFDYNFVKNNIIITKIA